MQEGYMPDDKKTKDKESKDVTSEKSTPDEAGAGPPAETASAPVERAPLTVAQAQRLRRKLKAKYH